MCESRFERALKPRSHAGPKAHMSESIHVPTHTVRRLRSVAKLFIPVITIAAGTAWTTSATWVRTRTSLEEIEPLIKKGFDEIKPKLDECNDSAKGAHALIDTQRVQIYALQQSALSLVGTLVELHAQAEVARAYGSSKRLPEYIERARRFYAREFERQLSMHPNDIVQALRVTKLAVWRPDRND